MRALVVSNMQADGTHPGRGSFVRDQVGALRRLGALEVELYEMRPGAGALLGGARDMRRRYANERFDVVHAHFGLTAWPALFVSARARALTVHGTDVRHPRTRLATGAVLPFMDLIGAVSEPLLAEIPGRRARARARVLACGVDMDRFHPLPRSQARAQLGLDPNQPYLLFPADPARVVKRHDRAQALAQATGAQLLTLGAAEPTQVPLWINACNVVVVPSEREGFGLAVLEALACDVPVLATPVGIHARALAGLDGTLCAPFDLGLWRAAALAHLHSPDPRVPGRDRAALFSADRMAGLVLEAWRAVLERGG